MGILLHVFMIKHGKLDVIGIGEAKINLGSRAPVLVLVEVEENCTPSCNPHHDKVWWEVVHEKKFWHKDYMLVLRWDVADLQTIKYRAE